MKGYNEAFRDIPGTVVFDATQSRLGYHLNQFCMSLMKAENRAAFKADERAYLERWPMTAEQRQAVESYAAAARNQSEIERMSTDASKQKTGVFTGSYAVNPVSGAKVPIWVADYVLGSYGTGALMAVPATLTSRNEGTTSGSMPARFFPPPHMKIN